MAEEAPKVEAATAAAEAAPAEGGEPKLSKNALKKKLKAEKAAKVKAEKEAKRAAEKAAREAAGGGKKKAEEEEILDPSAYKENRENAVKQMHADGINPYPHKFHVDYRLPDFEKEYDAKTENGKKLDDSEDNIVSVAGRIVSVRGQGKLYFYDISGDGTKLQIMSDLRTFKGDDEAFNKIHRTLKAGDIVGVTGYPGKSRNGQLSVFPTNMILLSPCLHMLPFAKGDSKLGGITNMETRYRQRYLDLIVNSDVRNTFQIRASIINGVRQYLNETTLP